VRSWLCVREHAQPRSQGLSSYRPPGGGKMRDPGNEVGACFPYQRVFVLLKLCLRNSPYAMNWKNQANRSFFY